MSQHVKRAKQQSKCYEAGNPPLWDWNDCKGFDPLRELPHVFLKADPRRQRQARKPDQIYKCMDHSSGPGG